MDFSPGETEERDGGDAKQDDSKHDDSKHDFRLVGSRSTCVPFSKKVRRASDFSHPFLSAARAYPWVDWPEPAEKEETYYEEADLVGDRSRAVAVLHFEDNERFGGADTVLSTVL
jgi:hypothetical protein